MATTGQYAILTIEESEFVAECLMAVRKVYYGRHLPSGRTRLSRQPLAARTRVPPPASRAIPTGIVFLCYHLVPHLLFVVSSTHMLLVYRSLSPQSTRNIFRRSSPLTPRDGTHTSTVRNQHHSRTSRPRPRRGPSSTKPLPLRRAMWGFSFARSSTRTRKICIVSIEARPLAYRKFSNPGAGAVPTHRRSTEIRYLVRMAPETVSRIYSHRRTHNLGIDLS